MRRTPRTMTLLGLLMFAAASTALGQAKGAKPIVSGFGPESMDIGPVVGLGGIGGAGASIGGRFEKAIKRFPELAEGVISVQLAVDFYSYDDNFDAGTDFHFRYIPFSGTVNYHVNTNNPKWDAFVGAGLGYLSASTSYNGVGSYGTSGLYLVGRLGGRYNFASNIAAYADVGAGAAVLNVGLMFRLKK